MTTTFRVALPRLAAALAVALPLAALAAQSPVSAPAAAELPVRVIPNLGEGAEFYFSPDNKSLIGNAKRVESNG